MRGVAGRSSVLLCLLLFLISAIAFWDVSRCDFINYDDYDYVIQVPEIRNGLSWAGLTWSFKTGLTDFSRNFMWTPAVSVSHQVLFHFFGLDPQPHHLVNVAIHALNAILLFLALVRLTGASGPSAVVAAVWAVHPLRVESVAWVVERKDVLSAFFWNLTILAYARYAASPGVQRYLITALAFFLCLLTKPAVAPLPLVLWLLDFWPLNRIRFRPFDAAAWRKTFMEKLPMLGLSVGLALWTASHLSKEIDSRAVPFALQASNAVISYVSYIGKLFWPTALAVFYPFPETTYPAWQILSTGAVLIAITVICLRYSGRFPYLAVGWFWYLLSLLPMIGLVRFAMADRYTYISHVGLLMALAWGAAELLSRSPRICWIAAVVTVGLLLALTRAQVRHWENSVTLFEQALRVTDRNFLAHQNLGSALAERGRTDEAIVQYQASLRIRSDNADVYNNLGNALARTGKLQEAVDQYSQALRYPTRHLATVYRNLGTALYQLGRPADAMRNLEAALNLEPRDALTHYLLGNALAEQGRLRDAARHFSEAVRLNPNDAAARRNLERAQAILSEKTQ